jgi:hypothetical protein
MQSLCGLHCAIAHVCVFKCVVLLFSLQHGMAAMPDALSRIGQVRQYSNCLSPLFARLLSGMPWQSCLTQRSKIEQVEHFGNHPHTQAREPDWRRLLFSQVPFSPWFMCTLSKKICLYTLDHQHFAWEVRHPVKIPHVHVCAFAYSITGSGGCGISHRTGHKLSNHGFPQEPVQGACTSLAVFFWRIYPLN